jgi:hypothetical protein
VKHSIVIPSASFLLGLSLVFSTGHAFAQQDEPEETEAAPGTDKSGKADKAGAPSESSKPTEATGQAKAEGAGATGSVSLEAKATGTPAPGAPVEMAPGAWRCSDIHQGYHPGYTDTSCYDHRFQNADGSLSLGGSLELDFGYAAYRFPGDTFRAKPGEEYEDLRGRFVFGPTLVHEFGSDKRWFVAATGQVVAWVRDLPGGFYKVNVDDVYGQIGYRRVFDFMLGRFETWRVYHKGLGFDQYTLEDLGALRSPGATGANYAVHTYEVNYIYYRRTPTPDPVIDEDAGRLALHVYPHRMAGIELAGAYGQSDSGTNNTLGGRLAGDLHGGVGMFLGRLSLGGEYRVQRPAARTRTQNPTSGKWEECLDCNVSVNKGYGGSAVVKVSIAELGVDYAKGWDIRHMPTAGADDPEHSDRDPTKTGNRRSYGGYLEVDAGKYTIKRPLIFGVGYQNTELVLKNKYFESHVQGAAYVAFPLGFNDAMLKFVLSRATAELWIPQEGGYGKPETPFMTAGRLRFKVAF